MGLTWIAIVASLLMGGGALLIFIWAVRSHQFKSFDNVTYQVFWSDPDEPGKPGSDREQKQNKEGAGNGSGKQNSGV